MRTALELGSEYLPVRDQTQLSLTDSHNSTNFERAQHRSAKIIRDAEHVQCADLQPADLNKQELIECLLRSEYFEKPYNHYYEMINTQFTAEAMPHLKFPLSRKVRNQIVAFRKKARVVLENSTIACIFGRDLKIKDVRKILNTMTRLRLSKIANEFY